MVTKLSVDDLLDQIGALTLIEAAELKKKMEDKFGVTAAAPAVGMMMAGPAPAPVEEKTDFDVILSSVGEKKIEVLKVLRELVSGLDLKAAKEIVDTAPKPIKEKVKKEEADQIKQRLEAAGAKVEIK